MIEILKDKKRLCSARVADTFFSRFMGLMFKKRLPDDEGLLIEYSPYFGSKSIHGFFMRFPIDLIFINRSKQVVELTNLKPWRIYSPKEDCKWVLEVNEGFIKDRQIMVPDVLSF
jgi:uncharacterized membrane protein (UPF0127 family)